ncbi:dTDP-4-dehydrorhamnose 3,5-epimerase [Flavobacteriaceae bacterium 3-367]|uniref:dTDP-4-dehydrorhamnose 3,5-epimerase n=1 Tax=Eudoraea algarum TaxID=3417568 RepID=UPI00328E3852
MIATETELKGCFVLEPNVFVDERGYFFESFNQRKFNALVESEVHFVQDNQSFSHYGVVRALHYQLEAYAQAKLVRVLQGRVLDVAVDIRRESETFGKHVAIELSAENKKQLFVPRGFAHGFAVLSESATFFYKCDNFYNKSSEGGIVYNDKELGIDWGLPQTDISVSERDRLLPEFKNAKIA